MFCMSGMMHKGWPHGDELNQQIGRSHVADNVWPHGPLVYITWVIIALGYLYDTDARLENKVQVMKHPL